MPNSEVLPAAIHSIFSMTGNPCDFNHRAGINTLDYEPLVCHEKRSFHPTLPRGRSTSINRTKRLKAHGKTIPETYAIKILLALT